MTRRRPLLPDTDARMTPSALAYRKFLHEDLYPKNQEWIPQGSGITSSDVTGSWVRQGRIFLVSAFVAGPSEASNAYLDLPFMAAQNSVFSVSIGGNILPAMVVAGESRLYLPNWNSVADVFISGVAAE